MKIPSDGLGEIQYMWVGMSKKVYKEMVKEMNIISSQEDASQQQCSSEVCYHSFILLCTSNLFIILNTNFQLFCCRKENKTELNQHIIHENKEEKG
jgi:hypothetical protein